MRHYCTTNSVKAVGCARGKDKKSAHIADRRNCRWAVQRAQEMRRCIRNLHTTNPMSAIAGIYHPCISRDDAVWSCGQIVQLKMSFSSYCATICKALGLNAILIIWKGQLANRSLPAQMWVAFSFCDAVNLRPNLGGAFFFGSRRTLIASFSPLTCNIAYDQAHHCLLIKFTVDNKRAQQLYIQISTCTCL